MDRCEDSLCTRLHVTKCLQEMKTSDIYLCLGISSQQSRSFFYAPRPKVQPMAQEIHASLIFCRFNKIANHMGPCAHALQKATFLISNDCTGSREGFTSCSWENVLPICLLSLCILRPLLSLDSHGSAKCSTIQGSFHVPVTLLEPLYTIAQQPPPSPFQVLLFILCGWWSFALRVCVSVHL